MPGIPGGVYGVVAFASVGGILFGLDQGNWAGAITKPGFQENFCLENNWGTEFGTCKTADEESDCPPWPMPGSDSAACGCNDDANRICPSEKPDMNSGGKKWGGQSCYNGTRGSSSSSSSSSGPEVPLSDDTKRNWVQADSSHCTCKDACYSQRATSWNTAYAGFISLGSGMMQFGAAFGALFIAPSVAVRFGRREGLFTGCIIAIIGNFGQALVTHTVGFIIMRILDGLGVGLITFSLPIFISEISPVEMRGGLGSMMQLTMVVGTVIASFMNQQPWLSYAWSFSMPAYPAIIVALGIFFFPRSPRFAIMKANRENNPQKGQDEAYRSLMILRNYDSEAVKEEIQDINESLSEDIEEKPWSYIFATKSVLRRLIIASMLQWLQQLSGINALLGMGPTILASAVPKEQLDPLVGTTFINISNLVFTVVMAVVIDKLGRRTLLLAGAAGMCIFMLLSAYLAGAIASKEEAHEDTSAFGWVLFFALMAYMGSFAIGWGGVPWVYPSEIFPMDVKEKCLSVSVFFQWMANFAIATGIPFMLNILGTPLTFVVFGICLVFAVFYVFFFIPETKGVKMEDMDALFGSAEEAAQIVYDGENTSSFACSLDAKARRPSQVSAGQASAASTGGGGGASFSEMTPSGRRDSTASSTPKKRRSSRIVKGPGASFTLA